MRTTDHTSQLDRVDHDIRHNLRLLHLAEWLHRFGNATLLLASIAIIITTLELFGEPAPRTAFALIIELLIVQLDLVIHLVGHSLRGEVDGRATRLRHELEAKGDELKQHAAELGLDWRGLLG